MKKITLDLTLEQADLLLPHLESGLDCDKDELALAPKNAVKNWRSMIKKLTGAIKKTSPNHP